jgi:predicted nucleotidyltransferase
MPAPSLVRSETAARVLALLASIQGEELHTNELIRRTGSNPNAIQRTLTQLETTGLLQSRRVGNLRLWRMDATHPLYASVRDLVVRTRGIPTRLTQILKRDPGIAFAFLFGSFVSAKDDAQSDVDVFVVGPVDWEVLAQAVRAASKEIGRDLRPVVWSLRDLEAPTVAQRAFLENVLADPVIWLVGDRDEFERRRGLARTVAEGGPTREVKLRARQGSRGRGAQKRGTGTKRTARR